MRKLQKTKEEKIAEQIADIVCDTRIDLDQVGMYLARLRVPMGNPFVGVFAYDIFSHTFGKMSSVSKLIY